jgi:predicted DNA-binding transcriptional regulator AlpA
MLDSTHTDSLLPFRAVQAATGLSRSTIYEKIGQGTFPAPIKIGRASRWSMIELQSWIECLRTQRNQSGRAAAST